MYYPLLYVASACIIGAEIYIARRFHSFDSSLPHSRAFFDRYYGSITGLSIFLSFFLGSFLTKFFHLPTLPGPSWWWITLGFCLIAGGYALRFYAIATLKQAFSVVLRVQEKQEVVSTGPYRFIRHPSYTGGLVAILGLGVLSGYPAAVVLLALCMLILFLVRIQREENILAHLPDYAAYRARTPNRLIPWIL